MVKSQAAPSRQDCCSCRDSRRAEPCLQPGVKRSGATARGCSAAAPSDDHDHSAGMPGPEPGRRVRRADVADLENVARRHIPQITYPAGQGYVVHIDPGIAGAGIGERGRRPGTKPHGTEQLYHLVCVVGARLSRFLRRDDVRSARTGPCGLPCGAARQSPSPHTEPEQPGSEPRPPRPLHPLNPPVRRLRNLAPSNSRACAHAIIDGKVPVSRCGGEIFWE